MEIIDNKKKPGFPGAAPSAASVPGPGQVGLGAVRPQAPALDSSQPSYGMTRPDASQQSVSGFGFMPGTQSVQPPKQAAATAPSFGAPSSSNRSMVASATPAPVVPTQQKPASAGVDGIPTGGPAGWTGGATQPAPKTAFGDLQSTIQNQVEKAVWGSTVTPPPSTGLPSQQKTAATPASPATSQANPLRVQEARAGIAAPSTSGSQPVALGMGKDIGFGVKRFDAPGQSPLFTNRTDAAGMADNQALMARGAPTAQNQAALNALVNRSTAEGAQAVQRMQFNDQVAQAQSINARPTADYTNPNDLRDPANIAARSQRMGMQIKSGESPQVYDARMRAIQESQRLAAMQGNANADRGFNRDRLLADQQIAQARLGMDKGRLDVERQRVGLDGQRVGNELATGQLNREEKGFGIRSAKEVADIQARYAASTDPKERAQLAQTLRGLAGKSDPAEWAVQVTPTTKNADGSTSVGSVYKYNKATGDVQQVDGGAQQRVTTPQQLAAIPPGTVYTGPDGKQYRKN